jgi:hypothetical protein
MLSLFTGGLNTGLKETANMTMKVGSLPGELPELDLFYSIDVECTVRDVELTNFSYVTKLVT